MSLALPGFRTSEVRVSEESFGRWGIVFVRFAESDDYRVI